MTLWQLDKTERLFKAVHTMAHCSDNWVYVVAFSGDESLCASASRYTARLWSTETGVCTHTVMADGWKNILSFSNDLSRVTTTFDDNCVRVWNVEDATPVCECKGHTDWVCGCLWTLDDGHVMSYGSDRSIRVWDIDTGDAPRTVVDAHSGIVYDICADAHTGAYVSASGDSTLVEWYGVAKASIAPAGGAGAGASAGTV